MSRPGFPVTPVPGFRTTSPGPTAVLDGCARRLGRGLRRFVGTPGRGSGCGFLMISFKNPTK